LGGGSHPPSPLSGSRQLHHRNRSLKKTAAVEEELDPVRDYNEGGGMSGGGGGSTQQLQQQHLQPVPRLLLPPTDAALTLQHLIPNVTVDPTMLLVPSPGSAYKLSPDSSRQASTELPSTSDFLNQINFPSNIISILGGQSNGLSLLGQLTGERKMESGDTDDGCALSPNPSFDLSTHTFRSDPSGLLQIHNSSTESQSSLTLPNKSTIQDEIRTGVGRFTLVRKKGRSEVWNLFGQVVDTVTNQRLPYVACYACKVLYTDTGGGTGNMTRHRCPLGSSFRSYTGSSTERNNSFDSYRSNRRSASPEAKRMHTNFQSLEEASALSPTAPFQSQQSHDSLSEEEKESLAESALRCCAVDLLHPATFQSRGFLDLASQLLKVGRKRSCAELFPDPATMSQNIDFMSRASRESSGMEMRDQNEVTISIERLILHGERFVLYHHTLGSSWSMKKSVIGVYPAPEVHGFGGALERAIAEYRIPSDKKVRAVVPAGTKLTAPNVTVYPDVIDAITSLVSEVVEQSSMSAFLTSLDALTHTFASLDLLPFFTSDWKDLNRIVRLYRMTSGWNNHRISIGEAVTHTHNVSLATSMQSVDWSMVEACATFLLPFYEVINSISIAPLPIVTILPEWFALMHVFESEGSSILEEQRKRIAQLLRERIVSLFSMEYKIAVVLNPKINRKLSLLFNENEKEEVFNAIRERCGLLPQENTNMDTSEGAAGELTRKRFLDSLEDASSDDELEAYVRSNCPSDRNILSFWSSNSRSKYPRLAQLARSILSIPAAAPLTKIDRRVASLGPEHVQSSLILRSSYQNQIDQSSS
ncbi:hypothetical protein PFISCL1PPCAC_16375, partial [Pristionchus fissidentatus]